MVGHREKWEVDEDQRVAVCLPHLSLVVARSPSTSPSSLPFSSSVKTTSLPFSLFAEDVLLLLSLPFLPTSL